MPVRLCSKMEVYALAKGILQAPCHCRLVGDIEVPKDAREKCFTSLSGACLMIDRCDSTSLQVHSKISEPNIRTVLLTYV